MASPPELEKPPEPIPFRSERLSELLAGAAAVTFGITACILWGSASATQLGPTTLAAVKAELGLCAGGVSGLAAVLLVSLFYVWELKPLPDSTEKDLKDRDEQRKRIFGLAFVGHVAALIVVMLAVGGVLPQVSIISAYQKGERNALLDQNTTLTWFTALWTFVWGIVRLWNDTDNMRTKKKPSKIPETTVNVGAAPRVGRRLRSAWVL